MQEYTESLENRFQPTAKGKQIAGVLAIVGIVLLLIGIFTTQGEFRATKFWSSILYNNLYFTWIAISAAFFITAFGLGYSGWHTMIKRIPEAIGHYMFVGLPLILVIFFLGGKYVYEWTDPHVREIDGIIQAKSWWLNNTTFIIFSLIWIVSLCYFFWLVRKNSTSLDKTGDYKIFSKSLVLSAGFLFFFAVANSVSTWHWVMSTEPHWYSTLYAWYLFASALVSMVAVMTIVLALLKKAGYLPYVNLNHFHDLGKFLFAFSIFWTYLWFSQHMLIWYANIPEETIHFEYLYNNHGFLFWFSFVINFFVPLIVLMSRDAKRKVSTLLFVSVVILIGHWIDFFLMIRPGTEKFLSHHLKETHPEIGTVVMQIGLTEIGIALAFIGLFSFVIMWALGKANIVPLNHPFEKESLEHHI